jgi:hypothetical protein
LKQTVAGPGMGKSTLLKKLARVYSRDSLPVMMIRLPRLVRQINNGGSFEKGIFILGLDVADRSSGDNNSCLWVTYNKSFQSFTYFILMISTLIKPIQQNNPVLNS